MPSERQPVFTFGRNWRRYSRTLDEGRLTEAEASVASLLGIASLTGLSFLDVGAGSGLFSIAAARLGASRVVALDRDPDCLAAIAANWRRFMTSQDSPPVDILAADVLDDDSLPTEQFDVVYAWGSLHHTGQMWTAIEHVARRCRPGGLFALAIYNATGTSRAWLLIKRLYHASPKPIGLFMTVALAGTRLIVRALRGKGFRTERGMSVWYDAVDWLGGLPYEYASSQQISNFLGARGFALERCVPTSRSGCNEFLFRRESAGRRQST